MIQTAQQSVAPLITHSQTRELSAPSTPANRQPTTDNRQPTTDNRQPTTDNRREASPPPFLLPELDETSYALTEPLRDHRRVAQHPRQHTVHTPPSPRHMHWSRYLVCLWPGLPELWYRGRWSGLPAALLFTAAINFLIVARFIYPEWLLPLLARIACWVAVAVWAMWVLKQISQLQTLLSPRSTAETPDGFPHAQVQYLRGNWPEAEAILNESLEIDPRDCQSLLLLASIYRQTQRWEAARETLLQLERLETADPWWLECETEARKLKRAIESARGPQSDDSDSDGPESDGRKSDETESDNGPADMPAREHDSPDNLAPKPLSPPDKPAAPTAEQHVSSVHKRRPPGDPETDPKTDSSEAAA